MAEFKLDYTAEEINEKLGKVDNISWNDLTDKPFEEVDGWIEIIPSQSINEFTDKTNYYQADILAICEAASFMPIAGKQYLIAYNSNTYICTAVLDPTLSMATWVSARWFIGNQGLIGGDDTGEPVCIIYEEYQDGKYYKAYLVQSNGDSCTFGISQEGKIVNKLDEKFLPEFSWNTLKDKPFGNESISITWDGSTDGRDSMFVFDGVSIYKVSDLILTKNDLIGAEITMSGETNIVEEGMIFEQDGIVSVEIIVVSGVPSDSMPIPSAGTYFVSAPDMGMYVSQLTCKKLKQLDEMFLPDTVVKTTDLEVYATTEAVTTAIETATEDCVKSEILTNYSTTSEVESLIATAIGNAIGGSY